MKALRYLNKYFLKYKYRLLFGIFITVLSKILALKVPSIIRDSINSVEAYQRGEITDLDLVKHQLLNDILWIIFVTLIAGALTFLMRQAIIVTSRLIEFDLKNEIYQQYQRLSINFYKKNRTGDLMNRISEDVSKVRMYLGPAIMYTVNMLVLFVIGFTKMLQIDVKLTLYTLLPFPILSISIFVLSKIINHRSAVVQYYLSKLTAFNQEVLSGIGVIKSYATEKNTISDFEKLAEKSMNKNINLYRAQALFFPLMVLLIGMSNILVIYIGGRQYIEGQTSLGVISEFILYVNILTWPVAVVGWVSSTVQQAEASQKRINEFLEQVPEIENPTQKNTKIDGKISFKNVSLTYDDTFIEALKSVSFTVNKGETLAIFGKTGSGKSSIVDLIARLYDPTEGTVLIDDIPIKNTNLNDIRDAIGFVPQDPFLFSDTIENNIRFGKEKATETEIITAAKNAVVHQNIIQFEKGYKTLLGERGVTLSGGQKQRISIARAIIKDPKILIFDDCLSAVDNQTEEKILQNLKSISKGKTTIIIGHRISSAKNANKIIVLDQGRIIQQGNHNQLINEDGYYKKLYEQQIFEKKEL